MLYDFFDDIVCINLDISEDRRKHAQHFFDTLNIPARFFTAKKHKLGGMYGCFDSHIQIIKEAYKNNMKNLLVLEDDFLPTASYCEDNMMEAINFMKREDYDIFHLGYAVIKDSKDGISSIFNAKRHSTNIVQYNPFCTQALCYSRKAMGIILENYNDYIGMVHYDMFISSYIGLTNYCIVPMLFDQNFYFQHNNESDDPIEYTVRSLFPIIAFTKLNYRVSWIKYRFSEYISRYCYLYFMCVLMYIVRSVGRKQFSKKNVCLQ